VPWQPLKHNLAKVPQFAKLLKHKFKPSDFNPSERLFRGFRLSETEQETGEIKANGIRFPDFSCNWERFSKPEDVKKRTGGLKTDGCYAFSVETSRFKKMATTCHDPNPEKDPKNYSHVEVRQLLPTEDIFDEPPKERELKKQIEGWSPSQKLEYRQHIVYHHERLIEPTA